MAAAAEVVPTVTAEELIERYDTILLDSFGVLVNSSGPLDGSREFIDELLVRGRSHFVVTNDASRLPESASERYRQFGLEIPAERIITSGSLLPKYFERSGLVGATCVVLGPPDSQDYVRAAGGVIVPAHVATRIDAVVVCDDAGYPFLETVDEVLSMLFAHFDRGDAPQLILPNPDLVYPKGRQLFGFTSGAVALLLEAALARRYPSLRPTFIRLGKPFGPIFREALRRASSSSLVMIGDQIETDIAGARSAGLHAALLANGVSRIDDIDVAAPAVVPSYLLESLAV